MDAINIEDLGQLVCHLIAGNLHLESLARSQYGTMAMGAMRISPPLLACASALPVIRRAEPLHLAIWICALSAKVAQEISCSLVSCDMVATIRQKPVKVKTSA